MTSTIENCVEMLSLQDTPISNIDDFLRKSFENKCMHWVNLAKILAEKFAENDNYTKTMKRLEVSSYFSNFAADYLVITENFTNLTRNEKIIFVNGWKKIQQLIDGEGEVFENLSKKVDNIKHQLENKHRRENITHNPADVTAILTMVKKVVLSFSGEESSSDPLNVQRGKSFYFMFKVEKLKHSRQNLLMVTRRLAPQLKQTKSVDFSADEINIKIFSEEDFRATEYKFSDLFQRKLITEKVYRNMKQTISTRKNTVYITIRGIENQVYTTLNDITNKIILQLQRNVKVKHMGMCVKVMELLETVALRHMEECS